MYALSFPLHPSSKVMGGSFVSLLSLLKFVITIFNMTEPYLKCMKLWPPCKAQRFGFYA